MAPRRGRGRQPKVSRMAAAIEAMAELGFARKLIRQKVNWLLKKDLYGSEGWRFIEEFSYRVLIEALLEEQANGDGNGTASLEQSKDGKHAETAGAGPSSSKDAILNKSCCGINTETSGAGLLSKDLSAQTEARCNLSSQTDARSDDDDAESSLAGPSSNKVVSVENDPSDGSEVEPSQPVASCSKVLFPCSNLEAVNKAFQSKDDLGSATLNDSQNHPPPMELPDADNLVLPTEVETQGQEGAPVTHSAQQVYTLPTRKRNPYHGWVGCKEDDFVILPEAPLQEVLWKMFILNVSSGKRKRKSRWDVQPEDI